VTGDHLSNTIRQIKMLMRKIKMLQKGSLCVVVFFEARKTRINEKTGKCYFALCFTTDEEAAIY
jgi:hypothetical protein